MRTETRRDELRAALRGLRATVIARLAHIRGHRVTSGQLNRELDGRTNQEAFDLVASTARGVGLLRWLFRRRSAPDPNP